MVGGGMVGGGMVGGGMVGGGMVMERKEGWGEVRK